MTNIVIIGMPGAGKSTLGVILAKALGMKFLDTDIAIQEQTGRLLQEIIDTEGAGGFLAREEATVLALACHDTVIATGGSVVFSSRAMEHLRSGSVIVYLEISCAEMEKRLNNITTRGIVLTPGQGLRDMYDQRIPLYEQYADITVRCEDSGFEETVAEVIRKIRETDRVRP
jgi:shikimate kinase